MDRQKVLDFIYRHQNISFYQPVVFIQNIMEIRGKWHEATKELAVMLFHDIVGKSVLDLGCNCGFFLHEARRQGAGRLVGVDHDVVIVKLAQEINNILGHDVEFMNEDIVNFHPNENFDVILMMNIFHVLSNPRDVIDQYLPFVNDKLIISCDNNQPISFDSLNIGNSFYSPRSVGTRRITEILKHN